MPMIVTNIVAMNPMTGPLMPKSNSASLFGAKDFCCITAPNVPRGGIPGIKYGYVASTLCLLAAILCAISCAPEMAIMAAVNMTALITASCWVPLSESRYPVISRVAIVARNRAMFIVLLLGFTEGLGTIFSTCLLSRFLRIGASPIGVSCLWSCRKACLEFGCKVTRKVGVSCSMKPSSIVKYVWTILCICWY